ncbi:zinc finger protein 771 isoform X2 [Nilaparvata lugens]|uniref:zinc finger protein 771 isoform X1 n=1 Tax=Nilaparvata lugens TaxID=108931 RepID=UPI00193DCB6F|nr:zinc finger protein 771 isoform X1 [Nilaparvata lugens]XP_039296607.1 zinc finger protein 771 isoform X2 [Nilaparvata lugens]
MERAECNEVWIKNEFNELENKDASSISSEDSYSKTIGENQVTDDEENLENNNLRQNFENEEEEEEEVGGEAKENNDYEIREEKWEEEVKEEEEDEAGNEDDEREGDIEEKTDIPDVLYPNILIENGSPIKLVDDLQEDLLNNLKPNENDDLAKAGVLIHCTKCKIILTSNAALLDHRKICSAVPYPMEKPPTPVITYPEFCDGRLANPKPTVRKRIRNKNKPKTQQKAALFEIRDGLFWCTQCSYKTATDSGLRHHRRAHQERLASFKCHLCAYGCAKSRDLERHLRTHTGERPFRCEICHYQCASLSNLKRHTMRHTGELPYACKECDFRCARVGTLEIHERTHNKQKPYQCKLCARAFAAASSLKRHEGMHAGDLMCNECDYRCGQKHLLKRHLERHERDRLKKKDNDGSEGKKKKKKKGKEKKMSNERVECDRERTVADKIEREENMILINEESVENSVRIEREENIIVKEENC